MSFEILRTIKICIWSTYAVWLDTYCVFWVRYLWWSSLTDLCRLKHSLSWRDNERRPSQITGVSVVCSPVCLGADQRKHQSPASLAFVRGNHRSPMNSPHKGPVTRKVFPFDDVTMALQCRSQWDTSLHIHRLPTLARNMLLIILC